MICVSAPVAFIDVRIHIPIYLQRLSATLCLKQHEAGIYTRNLQPRLAQQSNTRRRPDTLPPQTEFVTIRVIRRQGIKIYYIPHTAASGSTRRCVLTEVKLTAVQSLNQKTYLWEPWLKNGKSVIPALEPRRIRLHRCPKAVPVTFDI